MLAQANCLKSRILKAAVRIRFLQARDTSRRLSSVAAQAEEAEQGKRQAQTLSAAAQAEEAKFSTTHSASMDTRHSVRLFLFSSEQEAQAAQHRRSTRRTDSTEPPEGSHTSHSTGGIL
jgi:hypothetical protein